MNTKAAVEALLFLTRRSLLPDTIAFLIKATSPEVKQALDQLASTYEARGSAISLNKHLSDFPDDNFLLEELLLTSGQCEVVFKVLKRGDIAKLSTLLKKVSRFTFRLSTQIAVQEGLDSFKTQNSELIRQFRELPKQIDLEHDHLQDAVINCRRRFARERAAQREIETKLETATRSANDELIKELELQLIVQQGQNILGRQELSVAENNLEKKNVAKQIELAQLKIADLFLDSAVLTLTKPQINSPVPLPGFAEGLPLKSRIEVILFDRPGIYTAKDLSQFLDSSEEAIRLAATELAGDYRKTSNAIEIVISDTFCMRVKDSLKPLIFSLGVPQQLAEIDELIEKLSTYISPLKDLAKSTPVEATDRYKDLEKHIANDPRLIACAAEIRAYIPHWYEDASKLLIKQASSARATRNIEDIKAFCQLEKLWVAHLAQTTQSALTELSQLKALLEGAPRGVTPYILVQRLPEQGQYTIGTYLPSTIRARQVTAQLIATQKAIGRTYQRLLADRREQADCGQHGELIEYFEQQQLKVASLLTMMREILDATECPPAGQSPNVAPAISLENPTRISLSNLPPGPKRLQLIELYILLRCRHILAQAPMVIRVSKEV